MISTVTTSTVSSITSVTLIGTLGAISVVVLFTLLINKELVSASNDGRMLRLQRALNIALWPLIAVFILTVAVKISEIFS
jgi:hypothetical protein